MKFSEYLKEVSLSKATLAEDIIASIKDGKFTLDGSNLKVVGDFSCSNKQLTSLTGAPKEVTGDFYCSGNELTSLTGAPTTVTGNFNCYFNKLTSLTGAPTTVTGNFHCSGNQLKSLEGIHKIIEKMDGDFYATQNPIKTHVLGLLKIKGCKKVVLDNKEVAKILNKYLPEGDLFDCQEELIDAGFEEFAQL
jgi:hypothetical protein